MIYVVGIGPGGRMHMTSEALEVLDKCEVVIGYKTYLKYVSDLICNKEILESGMKEEIDRCSKAIELSKKIK